MKYIILFLMVCINTIIQAQNILPIIKLTGNFGYDYQEGTVSIIYPDGSSQDNLTAHIKWRGGSTNTKEKHKRNYKIKFTEDHTFFGLRNDNNWILDAGQADVFRLRNRIATELWNDFATKPYYINEEPKSLSGVRGEVVEVYLNDEYKGIYSFTECMDRKQLKLKKYDKNTGQIRGGLWKAFSYGNTPMWSCPPYDNSKETWDGFEVKYPELDELPETDYSTLYHAIDFVVNSSDTDFTNHVADYFDMPVVIDYYIFLYVLNAFDNRGKNIYWAVYDKTNDKKITPAVWDLDGTVGQSWINKWIPESTRSDYPFDDGIKLYDRLRRLNVDNFHEKVIERYQQLRNTYLSTANLIKRYQDYYDLLKESGAASRESQLWSGNSDVDGQEINFDKEIAFISEWWVQHMLYLDNKVFNTATNIHVPSATTTHAIYNLNGQRVDKPTPGLYIRNGRKIIAFKKPSYLSYFSSAPAFAQ